jgi:hypothetical protein
VGKNSRRLVVYLIFAKDVYLEKICWIKYAQHVSVIFFVLERGLANGYDCNVYFFPKFE